MGLDNYSPYFNVQDISKYYRFEGGFPLFPLIFILPLVKALSFLFKTPELVSNVLLIILLISGIYGVARLALKIPTHRFELLESTLLKIYIVFFSLTSLVTIWIFNQPNLIFMTGFATIPNLILLLSNGKFDYKVVFSLLIVSIVFMTTGLNVAAFLIYVVNVTLLSYLFRKLTSRSFSIIPLVWGLLTIVAFFLVGQFMIQNSTIEGNIFDYYMGSASQFGESEIQFVNSTGLKSAEANYSLFDNLRFATGWMEMNNVDNQYVFSLYPMYRANPLIVFAGIVTIIFIFYAVYKYRDKDKRIIIAFATFIVGIFLISKYFTSLLDWVPVWGNAFRWPSSKMWPIYFYPMLWCLILGLNALSNYKNKFNMHIVGILVISTLIYGVPLLAGNLVSDQVKVKVPQEYLDLRMEFEDKDRILYLPEPQRSYFRGYKWGYYGADFLRYILKPETEIIDIAYSWNYEKEYRLLEKAYDKCEFNKFSEVDYVIYDYSVKDIQVDIPECWQSKLTKETSYYGIYRLSQ